MPGAMRSKAFIMRSPGSLCSWLRCFCYSCWMPASAQLSPRGENTVVDLPRLVIQPRRNSCDGEIPLPPVNETGGIQVEFAYITHLNTSSTQLCGPDATA